MKAGSYVEPSKTTLAQFFDRWLKHIKPNVSPRTHERYSDLLNKNLAPLLGAKILSKLQPIDISEAYGKALENGRRDGKGGLSPRTVHHMHRVLYSALGQAERWKLISAILRPFWRSEGPAQDRAQVGRHPRRAGNRNRLRCGARAAPVYPAGPGQSLRPAPR